MLYLISAFVTLAAASYTSKGTFVPNGAQCQDYTIPVTATSEVRLWNGTRWTDNYGYIDVVSTLSSRTSAGFPQPYGEPVNQTASYNVSATFCTPQKAGQHSKTVLFATHGLAFDRGYWNSPYEPDKYNFVQYAVNKGYSVFFYDRVGVGKSTKISGYDAQISITIAVLTELAKSVRQGLYTTIGKPAKVVVVGHSFGSYSSNAAIAENPGLADAAILTGYGLNGSGQLSLQGWAPRVARLQRPSEWSDLDFGYVTTGDVFSTINNFFKAGAYDHAVARFSEANKQPFAVGELVSIPLVSPRLNAPNFKGPTLVISGEFDFVVCGGYCRGVLDVFRSLFRGSSDFQSYVQPKSGHDTNFATNATGFYGVIFDFLSKHNI